MTGRMFHLSSRSRAGDTIRPLLQLIRPYSNTPPTIAPLNTTNGSFDKSTVKKDYLLSSDGIPSTLHSSIRQFFPLFSIAPPTCALNSEKCIDKKDMPVGVIPPAFRSSIRLFSTAPPGSSLNTAASLEKSTDKKDSPVSNVDAQVVVQKGVPDNIFRPLSPHLSIYQPQLSSTLSIFNRISAIYLTALVLFFYLGMKMGSICFTYPIFYGFIFYSSKLALISVEIAALALVYHIFASIKHKLKLR